MGFSSFGKVRYQRKSYNRLLEETKTNFSKKSENKPVVISKADESGSEIESDIPDDVDENINESADGNNCAQREEVEFQNPEDRVPCENMLNIENGKKLVSSISIDTSGSRILIGGHDCNFNMYDFATMDSKFLPFRKFKPLEDVPLRAIKHSPACDLVMVYGNTNLIKLLDRDGRLMSECMRGDRYIVDMCKTKGHVSEINSAAWNPIDLNAFITAGMDHTIRIWNVEDSDTECGRILKLKTRLKNSPCVEVLYNPPGTLIYGACLDGSLNIWDPRKSTPDPVSTIPDAHQNGSPAYSLIVSRNEQNLVSRGYDETLKIWDFRNFKKPIKSLDLPNCFDTTRVVFSPDYKMVITGTSTSRGKENCALNFYSLDLELLKTIPFNDGCTPIIPAWHPKLNQLFVGCSDGNVKAFFNPKYSIKGILLCMNKIHKVRYDEGEELLHEQIFNPYSKEDGLEMTNVNVRKLQIKARRDPYLTRKPEPPVYGPGQGGRLTTAMSLAAFVCKSMLPIVPPSDESNPRESILKYSKLAEEEPYFVAPAYEKTQPVPIFRDPALDEEEDDSILKKKKTI
ncbi:Gastrulation defective protein 1 [Thelohanellus kitauei]|uniref:Gastrulation defective protein 1 n=1 Tax=Thelohanellus kitauei TaxID=669202 RepID=A0A0C2JAP6_THEKT|nr:Gastrulation defective protein 1 [Thelohanellus kitauei]